MNSTQLNTLRRKNARHAAGLAPEDETRATAEHTARVRGDLTYMARWEEFQASWHGRYATDADKDAMQAACTCTYPSQVPPRSILSHKDSCAAWTLAFTGIPDSVGPGAK